ncbi:MAG: DUF1365 domain-containing protein [Cypionkella sp.]
MNWPDHIVGTTYHGRRGAVANAFRYGIDYVLIDPDSRQGPNLFSRNRANLTSLWDVNHGGAPLQGKGVAWCKDMLAAHNLPTPDRIELLAQPRVLGHVFNPVAFWLCWGAGGLQTVIAEVSNTYGDRHSYLCHRDDLAPMKPDDTVTARKIFHVSPFQPVEGDYAFRFDITAAHVGIWIDYTSAKGSLIATLTGKRKPLTNASILAACLRRPFGSRRVLGLIHWQALRLWWKGARFHNRPEPPADEVSR